MHDVQWWGLFWPVLMFIQGYLIGYTKYRIMRIKAKHWAERYLFLTRAVKPIVTGIANATPNLPIQHKIAIGGHLEVVEQDIQRDFGKKAFTTIMKRAR